MQNPKYKAVVFDLYTALLDSWSLWNRIAGSPERGTNWRQKYLQLTYQAGSYRAYEDIIVASAEQSGLSAETAQALINDWASVNPWPETNEVLHALSERVPLAIATNSSVKLAEIAVARLGVSIPAVATAEESGYYKPQPQTYRLALERVGASAENTLFVAGSASDVPGAMGVGLQVFWHNRARLAPLAGQVAPQHLSDSLEPLLELV